MVSIFVRKLGHSSSFVTRSTFRTLWAKNFTLFLFCLQNIPFCSGLRPSLHSTRRYFSSLPSAMSESNGVLNTNHHKPIVIGLTGSIGMGKSTVTKQLARLGIPVFDADQAVHDMYACGGCAVEPLRQVFPNCISPEGSVDRSRLSMEVMSNPAALKEIEAIVHPLVISQRKKFYEDAVKERSLLIVYDIPLLLEQRAKYEVDYVVVVTASAETQRQRVLARPGMTEEKFQSILSKQLPNDEKIKRADYVISTDYDGYVEGRAQLAKILEDIVTQKDFQRFEMWRTYDHADKESKIDAVVFDLDDTLCPMLPTMTRATEALQTYMRTYMPKTCESLYGDQNHQLHGKEGLKGSRLQKLMKEKRVEYGHIVHDLVEFRRRILYEEAQRFNEEMHVDQAMEARTVTPEDLYPDAREGIHYLNSKGISCHILTNGGHPLKYLGRARHPLKEIDLFLTPGELGINKPHCMAFIPFVGLLKTFPRRILFVGDCYDRDVCGAKNVGFSTVWLKRVSDSDVADEVSAVNDGGCADFIVNDIGKDSFEKILNSLK